MWSSGGPPGGVRHGLEQLLECVCRDPDEPHAAADRRKRAGPNSPPQGPDADVVPLGRFLQCEVLHGVAVGPLGGHVRFSSSSLGRSEADAAVATVFPARGPVRWAAWAGAGGGWPAAGVVLVAREAPGEGGCDALDGQGSAVEGGVEHLVGVHAHPGVALEVAGERGQLGSLAR